MNNSHLFLHVENCCIQALKGQIPNKLLLRKYLSNKFKDLLDRNSQETYLWKEREVNKTSNTLLYKNKRTNILQ
jgi:hypothetical protein